MRCQACQYELVQLSEHRCPECGRPFDPADAETFLQPEPRSVFERVIVIGALLVVGPLVLLALLFVIAVLSQLWQLLKLICADLCHLWLLVLFS